MKISIITVCYNAELTIESTIKSVVNQTYRNIEYIIIDGGSTDATLEIIDKYKNYYGIKVYSEPDFGIYNAMNRGISRASGEYVYFINAGDTISSDIVIETVVSCIDDKKAIYYGYVQAVKPGYNNKVKDYELINKSTYEKLIRGNMPCHQAIFAPLYTLRGHYFDENYKLRADFKWFYQCMMEGIKTEYIPIEIAKYDMRGESASEITKNIMERETKLAAEYCLKYDKDRKVNVSFLEKSTSEWESVAKKHLKMVKLLIGWITLNENNIYIESYFEKRGFRHVSIYGMGYIGEKLLTTLEKTSIVIDCVIDKKKLNIVTKVPILEPECEFPDTQCVVVTALADFVDIRDSIQNKVSGIVVSIEEVIEAGLKSI